MALSKESDRGDTSWQNTLNVVFSTISASAESTARASAQRLAAPFIELAEDVSDSAAQLVLPRRKEVQVLGNYVFEVGSRRLVAFSELAEDTGITGSQALAPAMMLCLAAPNVSPAVFLCSFAVPTKMVYCGVSVVMAVGAWCVWGQHPDGADRTVQRRGAVALLTCSGLHLAMAVAGSIPAPLASYCVHPEIVVHYLEDYVMSPMLIMNLGYLTGLNSKQMLPCIAYSLVSTTASIGAAIVPTQLQGLAMMASGLCFMGMAATTVNQLPQKAAMISTRNQLRTQVAGDLMVFGWTLYPLVQGLGLLNAVSIQGQMNTFALLDVLTKLGATHIMLRSRHALQSASEVFGEVEDAAADATREEPFSEPQPQRRQSP